MEEKTTLIKTLVESVETYTKSSVDLLKLKAINKSADIGASIVSSLIFIIAILCITMMVNIGVAIWIGGLIGNLYCGFFLLSAFYIIAVIVISYFKKPLIVTPVCNHIIEQMRQTQTVNL